MDFGVDIPFVQHLGFELVLFERGHSEIRYAAQQEHENSFSVVHGGALMTLLDVSMATSARSVQQDMGVVTIEMKTTFMRAAKGKLTAEGRLVHRTPTLAFAQSMVYDAKGEACAHSTGTFKFVKRLPVGKGAHPLNVLSTD